MTQDTQAKAEKPSKPQTGPMVTITINGVKKEIHRGHTTIAELKALGNIPLADQLEQIIDGKITPLPDDGAVTIKGGEVFISHVKDGGAS